MTNQMFNIHINPLPNWGRGRGGAFVLFLTFLLFQSCSDFTDIEPKGKNLLETTDQLELLLNQNFNTLIPYEYQNFIDESYFCGQGNIETMKTSSEVTQNKIITLWDESVPMSERQRLNNNDLMYMGMYQIIGTVANPILLNIDNATGPETTKNRIKAEALTLRAWYHYLLVNCYAKAYNAATASTDAGIPYQLEDIDNTALSNQNTVQEVYDHILTDINAAIDLNALPDQAVNTTRVSKPFAYAVKAQVLMSLGRYDEASQAAQQSLDINSNISDYNEMVTSSYGTFVRTPLQQQEDLFATYAYAQQSAWSPEMLQLFEPNSVLANTYFSDGIYIASSAVQQYQQMAAAQGMTFEQFTQAMLGMPLTVQQLTQMLAAQYNGMLTQQMIGIQTPMYIEMGAESEFNTTGLTTADNILLQAECAVRSNDLDRAASLLNTVRQKRLYASSYQPLTFNSKAEAIQEVERAVRCEKVYSILGFVNLKRWNQDSEWAVTLTRNINGDVYTLSPSSPLWVWPFPSNDVTINPNLIQDVETATSNILNK